ncbi:MAG: PAS domain S-box protein [Fimbriimonadaceae bacterium]
MSEGSNVRNLNWDELDHSALHGAGDVVTRVQFWQKTWFLSMLFALCLSGLIATFFVHLRIIDTQSGIIYLREFSKEISTIEGLEPRLQLDLILRERVGIQDNERLVRRADSQIAFKVGSAWTRVRRAALIPEVDSAVLRAAKQESDRGISSLVQSQKVQEQIFGGLTGLTACLLIATLIVAIQALRRRATTLVVQSLDAGGSSGTYADISASSAKESEAITKAVNNLPIPIVEFESDGRILRWNDQMHNLTGIPAQNVLGKNVIECLQWGTTSEAAKSTIRKIFSGESIPKLEWTLVHTMGESLELQASIKPVIDGGGAVRSAAAVIRDVTSEKYGRDLMVANDVARLAIIKALPDSLLRFDSNLNLVEIHDNSQILVSKVNLLRGDKWREGFGADLTETFCKAAKQAQLTQKPYVFQYSGELAGRHVTIGFRVAVAGPTDILAIVTDLNDRQRTLEADLRGEAKFKHLIEGSADAVMMVSAEGIVLYASPAVRPVLGIDVESIVGRNWQSLVEKDSRDVAESGWQESLKGSSRFVLEVITGGALNTVEISSRNLLEEESVGAVVFNIRNITERRRLEVELTQRLLELEIRTEELRDAAQRDPLTGTLNYQALLQYLEAICDYAADRGSFSAILFDIDNFKTVNAEHGYLAGDDLLCMLANVILEFSREEDILGRAGAEEFLLILPEADTQVVERITESVRKKFAENCKELTTLSVCSVSKQKEHANSSSVLQELNGLVVKSRVA